LETLEDLIRQAVKKLLDDLLLLEDAKTLDVLGLYRQKREYASKNMGKSKSLPRMEPILAALIRLDREIVITDPYPELFAPGSPKPNRIIIRALKEYAENQVDVDSLDTLDRNHMPSPVLPVQMSLLTALEFPRGLQPEIIGQSVTKKGPHRVELSLGMRVRRTSLA
jgi:hypothetical protein